jgi:hypothetical protein
MRRPIIKYPVITDDSIVPSVLSVREKETVTFTVDLDNGIPPVFYQWYFNDLPIRNAIYKDFTIVNVKQKHSGKYKVSVKNKYGEATSLSGYLTVSKIPVTTPAVRQAVTFESGYLIADIDGFYPIDIRIPDQSDWDISNGGYTVVYTQDCTVLNTLNCSNNSLTSLDISTNSSLSTLDASTNSLGQSSIDEILASLILIGNYNGILDLSGTGNSEPSETGWGNLGILNYRNWNISVNGTPTIAPASGYLIADIDNIFPADIFIPDQASWNIGGGGYTVVYTQDCTTLTDLICNSNYLSSLDVSTNSGLQSLTCYSNSLTSLDIYGTPLTTLDCRDNQLTSLDISSNGNLIDLYCDNNQLTTLDISSNTNLLSVYCVNNYLSESAIDNILSNLVSFGLSTGFLDLSGGSNAGPSVAGIADVNTLQSRGWSVTVNV